jgi:hypothetical protein
MNILYVVSRPIEINTSASIRNHATIMGLLDNGHQVTIVSSEPDVNHASFDRSLMITKAKKIYLKLGGIQSVAKLGRRWNILNKIKPVVYHILFRNEIYDNMKMIVDHVEKINIKDYDLVISSSDPKSSHLFVDRLFALSEKMIPWIQIWGDPFADDITRKKSRNMKKIEIEENRLLSKADKIVYVSKMTCEAQKLHYPENQHKMFYFPIPYYKARRSKKVFPVSYKEVELCYCGDYGSHVRNLVPLYEAVKEMGLSLKVCGMSDLNLKSSDKIQIFPRQEAVKVREFETNADVLVFLSNLSGTQIPGKIYQYISTDKTILFILDGDKSALKNIFSTYNRFIFVNNQKGEIKSVLRNICKLREKVSNEPVEYFSAKNIAEKIIVLESVGK